MNEHLSPAGDRVLIRLRAPEKKSAGGIVFVEETVTKSKYATQRALVVACGWDAYKGLGSGKAWCTEGDTVRVSKYSGDDMDDIEPGYVYRIISDEDVHATYPNQRCELDVSYGDQDNDR